MGTKIVHLSSFMDPVEELFLGYEHAWQKNAQQTSIYPLNIGTKNFERQLSTYAEGRGLCPWMNA
jgi:hypothetical protein